MKNNNSTKIINDPCSNFIARCLVTLILISFIIAVFKSKPDFTLNHFIVVLILYSIAWHYIQTYLISNHSVLISFFSAIAASFLVSSGKDFSIDLSFISDIGVLFTIVSSFVVLPDVKEELKKPFKRDVLFVVIALIFSSILNLFTSGDAKIYYQPLQLFNCFYAMGYGGFALLEFSISTE